MYTNLEDAENLREMKELQEHILDVRMFCFFFSLIFCVICSSSFFFLSHMFTVHRGEPGCVILEIPPSLGKKMFLSCKIDCIAN